MFKKYIKNFIKKLVRKSVRLFTFLPGSGYLHQQVIEGAMEKHIVVQHQGIRMAFTTPNALCRYRAESFSSKEPETLNWLDSIPSGAVLWDVGANVGLYSVYATKRNNVRVFAFEPSVFNLELLARNVSLNDQSGLVTIVPLALSDALGSSLFRMSTTDWGGALSTFGRDVNQHGGKLNSIFEYQMIGVTMDEAIRLLHIPQPSFIKIDVDGIEHFILKGGGGALKSVESVMVEVDDGFTEQAEQTADCLRSAGLTLLRKCWTGGSSTQYNQWWVRGRE